MQNTTLEEETFAVQPNRKIFTFCGNKLLRFIEIEKNCGINAYISYPSPS